MRGLRGLLGALLVMLAAPARATPPPGTEERYEHEKKSVGLAITLEAISPIAGMGCLYGGENDQGTVLALVSAGAIAAGVGGTFWLIHLNGQSASGFSRATLDAEQGFALSMVVAGGITYILARISGLSVAPDATRVWNANLRQNLGLPPLEPTIPFHAWAPLPGLAFQF